MNINKGVTISSSVFFQKVDDEIVLIDMVSENYFGLNSVGTDVWQLLHGGKTLQETNDALLEMYEVEPEELEKDLFFFVKMLMEKGLLAP